MMITIKEDIVSNENNKSEKPENGQYIESFDTSKKDDMQRLQEASRSTTCLVNIDGNLYFKTTNVIDLTENGYGQETSRKIELVKDVYYVPLLIASETIDIKSVSILINIEPLNGLKVPLGGEGNNSNGEGEQG